MDPDSCYRNFPEETKREILRHYEEQRQQGAKRILRVLRRYRSGLPAAMLGREASLSQEQADICIAQLENQSRIYAEPREMATGELLFYKLC